MKKPNKQSNPKQAPVQNDKKGEGELSIEELEKAAGGVAVIGGGALGGSSSVLGDPDEGGEGSIRIP